MRFSTLIFASAFIVTVLISAIPCPCAASRIHVPMAVFIEDADLIVVGTLSVVEPNRRLLREYEEGGPHEEADRGDFKQQWWHEATIVVTEVLKGKGEHVYGGVEGDTLRPSYLIVDLPGISQKSDLPPGHFSLTGGRLDWTPLEGEERIWLLEKGGVRWHHYRIAENPMPPDSLAFVRRCIEMLDTGYQGVEPGLRADDRSWMLSGGGPGRDSLRDMAVDSDGSVVFSGRYQGPLRMGDNFARTTGSSGYYIARLDPHGDVTWCHTSEDGGGTTIGSLTALPEGDFAISLVHHERIALGDTTLERVNGGMCLIARCDPQGNPRWVRDIGSEIGVSLAASGDGAIIAAGTLRGSLSLQKKFYRSSGETDICLIRLSPSGEVEWVRTIGGESSERCSDVATDGSGNMILACSMSLSRETRRVEGDAEVRKFSSDGVEIWRHHIDSPGNDAMLRVAVGPDDSIYAYGWFGSEITGGQVRLMRLSEDGSPIWERNLVASDLAVDRTGNVIVVGRYGRWPSIVSDFPPVLGDNDVVIIGLNPAGEILWIRRDGGMSEESAGHVAITPNHRLIVSGSIWGTSYIAGKTLRPFGARDIFVMNIPIPEK